MDDQLGLSSEDLERARRITAVNYCCSLLDPETNFSQRLRALTEYVICCDTSENSGDLNARIKTGLIEAGMNELEIPDPDSREGRRLFRLAGALVCFADDTQPVRGIINHPKGVSLDRTEFVQGVLERFTK